MNRTRVAFAVLAVVAMLIASAVPLAGADASPDAIEITDAYYVDGRIHYSVVSSDVYVWGWVGDGSSSQPSTTAKVENPAEDTEVDAELEAYILEKIEERKAAKKEKDFAKADAIRDDLLAKGIVLKDTREGVIWHKA